MEDEYEKKSHLLRRKYYVVERKYLVEEKYYDEEEEENSINYDFVSIDHELKSSLEKFYQRHDFNFIIQLIGQQDDRFITIHHKLEFKRINGDWIESYLFIQNKNERYMTLYKMVLPQRGGDYMGLLKFLKKFNLSPNHDFIDHVNQTRILEFIIPNYHPLIVIKMMNKGMKKEL